MKIVMGIVLLMVSGCAAMGGGPNMNVDQLRAIASDKNASVICSTILGPFGTGKVVVVNLDQRVIMDGSVATDENCKVTITNQIHDKPMVPATPKPAP